MDFRSYTLEPNRIQRISIHILFWVSVIIFQVIYGLGYSQPILVSLFLAAVYLPAQLISTYLFVYIALKFVQQGKWVIFVLLTLALTIVNYLITHINRDLGIGSRLVSWHEPHSLLEIVRDFDFFFWYNIHTFIVVFVATTVKLIKDHFISRALLADLESVKVQNETNLIRINLKPELLLVALDAIKTSAKVGIQNTPHLINDLSLVLDDAIYRNSATKRSIIDEVGGLQNICKLYQEVYKSILNIAVQTEIEDKNINLPTRILVKTSEIYIEKMRHEFSLDHLISLTVKVIQMDRKVILQIEENSGFKLAMNKENQNIVIQEISNLISPNSDHKIEVDFFEGSENNEFQ